MAEVVPLVIQTKSLSKTYEKNQVLKPLDLEVSKNSIFGFLGPNGAGKTTTIKLLLGLIWPSGGSGQVFGLDIARQSVEIRARVGYLPQEPRFYEHMSARETLRYTLHFFFKGPQKACEERIEEMLELVELQDKADRPIRSFSGGERQRLGLAQAEVNYPDLLILDEPAASLDPMGRHAILELMERLRKYCTIFYSTHILDDVQKVSDTVAILNHGELVSHGPIGELLTGSEGPAYKMTLANEDGSLQGRLLEQAWVKSVNVSPDKDGGTTWLVAVKDAPTAEAQLLRLALQEPSVSVLSFGKRQYELEDVFLQIIEGADHGR